MENKETLEEAAEKEFPLIDTEWCRTDACEEENLHLLGHRKSFIKGANWQAKRMYSEENMKLAFETGRNFQLTGENNFNELIEQFKKQRDEQ
jgi:hypothetical protein